MKIILQRFSDANGSTIGLLFVNGRFECYVLEDQRRTVKVAGKTRIPAGTYPVAFRETDTPMTGKYRARFGSWFKWHLWLQDVPGFSFVYLHVGNDEDDTDGCLLVGDTLNNNSIGRAFMGNSVQAFSRLYQKISTALLFKEPVEIEVRDESWT